MKKLLSEELFLKKFHIAEADFKNTSLDWQELVEIHSDFETQKQQLAHTAEFIANGLMKLKRVHSVRHRIKDEEHLIEKIIRKKIENPERDISLKTYLTEITDLIGIRALYLFKEEWFPIHQYITSTWNLKQKPIAYYREGDTTLYTDKFKEKGCEVKIHRFGYRSIHYVIESCPARNITFAEIQIRTIFEDGWSEIDHRIRYPYERDNELYNQFLSILNRLAGSADEMGSFINKLQITLVDKETEFLEKNERIQELEKKVQKLDIKESEKKELREDIKDFKVPPPFDPFWSYLESVQVKFNNLGDGK